MKTFDLGDRVVVAFNSTQNDTTYTIKEPGVVIDINMLHGVVDKNRVSGGEARYEVLFYSTSTTSIPIAGKLAATAHWFSPEELEEDTSPVPYAPDEYLSRGSCVSFEDEGAVALGVVTSKRYDTYAKRCRVQFFSKQDYDCKLNYAWLSGGDLQPYLEPEEHGVLSELEDFFVEAGVASDSVLPVTDGSTFCIFRAEDVPVGTKVYVKKNGN